MEWKKIAACGNKHSYPTTADARKTLAHKSIEVRRVVNIYRCRFCGGFHIGHAPNPDRGKQIRKTPKPKKMWMRNQITEDADD